MLELGTSLRDYLVNAAQNGEIAPELAEVVYQISITGGKLSKEIAVAALRSLAGYNGIVNTQGEEQKHLDVFANDLFIDDLKEISSICAIATEEEQHIHVYDEPQNRGVLLVCLDPVDGSSNSDVNAPIATIFGIMKKESNEHCSAEDFLQDGRNLIAAGYMLYGPSTIIVFATTENGVQGFTFDPESEEFYLTHPDISFPDQPSYYSVNEAYSPKWDEEMNQKIDRLKTNENSSGKALSARYFGALGPDFHRNLIDGGIFMYLADKKHQNGKLRLLFECFPMAFVAELAGGTAIDGYISILDKVPTDIHQRSVLIVGNQNLVSDFF